MNREMIDRILLALGISVAAVFSSCSTGDVAGGGTDMPNGATVAGILWDTDSSVSVDAEVALRSVVVTDNGDSIADEWVDSTDSKGRFEFSDIASGRYVMLASSETKLVIQQFVDIDSANDTTVSLTGFDASVDIVGHILLEPNTGDYAEMRVFVPGLHSASIPDSMGFYRLGPVPRGEFEIGFALDNTVNFARVRIDRMSSGEVYLRDIQFALMDSMADDFHQEFVCTQERAYYVSPKPYALEEQPEYYHIVDTANVQYYQKEREQLRLKEWLADSQNLDSAFPAAGTAHRDSAGQIYLRRLSGEKLDLVGPLTAELPLDGSEILVFIKRQESPETAEPEYRVLDFKLKEDRPPPIGASKRNALGSWEETGSL